MKVTPVLLMLLIFIMGSCKKEDLREEQRFMFVKKYCATVTVGGVVGLAEKCFETGDVIIGYRNTEGTITIRIAAHSYLNDGPPTSASHQEFLDVPADYLELL